ncbi:hypothetical protein NMK43_08900 [Bacillus licheniformis]|uniref:hypothetical protein n=1 Tax=Bacillus licheniformis TaxID=1402 RepID=UPI0020C90F42|nr:hypothetical protein [Bacillus licheniformis]MCP8973212.1 hypothetical protein [Bacillus licheniformis]
MQQKLKNCVLKFMQDNEITCEEAISQSDQVIENVYEFIEDLYNIVKEDLEAVTSPPTYEELLNYLMSKGIELNNIRHGGDGSVWVVAKLSHLSIDLHKHDYYYKSDEEKLSYLRFIKELFNIE